MTTKSKVLWIIVGVQSVGVGLAYWRWPHWWAMLPPLLIGNTVRVFWADAIAERWLRRGWKR